MPNAVHLVCMALVMFAASSKLFAQAVTQSFALRPGWNAVFWEVDPLPSRADELFADLPFAAVWTISQERSADTSGACAGDLDDPVCTAIPGHGWRVWFPPGAPHHEISTMHRVRGGRVYLIQATEATTLTITGAPHASKTHWRAGKNLAGFHVSADAPPTFASYLSPSPAHRGAAVYEINPAGELSAIADLAGQRIAPGQGYWVESQTNTTYDGPLLIDNQSLRGVDLSSDLEHSIRVENLAADVGEVTISNLSASGDPDSAAANATRQVPLIWLDYADSGDPNDMYQRRPLDAKTWVLGPRGEAGAKRVVRIALDRRALGETNRKPGASYEGLLSVRSARGFRRLVPIRFDVGTPVGLWVGTVTVDAVSRVQGDKECGNGLPCAIDGDCGTGQCQFPTLPAGSEFTFRIIIHKSAIKHTLLTEATLVTIEASGETILVTPACSEQPDARDQVSLRISTAAFGFESRDPASGALLNGEELSGDFSAGLNAVFDIVKGERLNPFTHLFHPDHECTMRCDGGDNPDKPCVDTNQCPGGSCILIGGDGGCVRITRTIDLDFDNGNDPAMGGIYTETLSHLHKTDIRLQGRFVLRKVSDIPTLCDEP